MKELSKERRLEILRSLGSTECGGCQGTKKPKMSHCRTCYFDLPPRMRKALYQDFGDGYEEAYEASLGYLKELKETAAKRRQASRVTGIDPDRVYRGSDGAATRRLYAALEKRGPIGIVALNLFRAQKCSKRAKKYGPYSGKGEMSYRDLSYERKGFSLKQLTEVLQTHGATLGITFGWGRDDNQPFNKWVLYIDLTVGQVSFHSPERFDGPDYSGGWDGLRMSEERIIEFCQGVLC
jgi:hypothetical protein